MPAEGVARCRAAWARLSGGERCVVHGDPNSGNIRMTVDRVALVDWDESHVDVPDLDLVLPHNAADLDDDTHDVAAQAKAAWEAAVCWDSTGTDEFAARRLAEVRAVCAASGNESPPDSPLWRSSPERAIFAIRDDGRVALQRMDNVGIVVESLDAAISFFAELGLELEGRAMIEGDWSGRVTGLRDQRVEIAMMRMPDGHGKIELSRFLPPPPVADNRNAPVNALGYLRVMFAVDDLDDTLARLREHGAQVVDEVVQYEDVYRLCYVRGPEGILIGLAEQIG